MNKYFYILSLTFLIVSCGKESESFKPTTTLKLLLKNEKLNRTYYEFRTEKVFLESRLDTVKSFKKFVAETSVEELVSLTECEQPVVRCFAFKALVEKDYPEIRKVLFRHKSDNEIIKQYSRCIELHESVKNYMLIQLEPFAKTKYRFSRTEYDAVQKDFNEN